jgi:Flp pilus assembly pilin Flp
VTNRNRDREVNLHAAFGYAHARLAWCAARLGRLLDRQRGQGTVEYVALVLLVALVMFGVITAMKAYKSSQGQELGDLILNKIKEAVGKVRY